MLSNVIRVGDRVVFNRPKDYYPSEGDPADKMQGTVVSKERYIDHRARFGFVIMQPGVYEVDGVPNVKWDNGTTTTYRGHNLDLVDAAEYEQRLVVYRERNKNEHWVNVDAELENRVRLSDLPETKAWELDFVKVVSRHGVEYGIIEGIEYHWKREDTEEIRYRFRIVDTNKKECGGTTYARDSEIEVIERGNVWKHFHNEPLAFVDLHEEARFYAGLGQSKEVRNPRDGMYGWSLVEAMQAIKDDLIDSISVGNIPFAMTSKISATRFENRELGKRLQAATLEGFKDANLAEMDQQRDANNESIRASWKK
jgi:hypothetical protein